MQEEFEKKVQERVHTFGITPSPQVWDEVDAVLSKRKHHRVFIGWWILLGLVIAGGGVLLYEKDNILHNEINQRPVTTGDTVIQNNLAKATPVIKQTIPPVQKVQQAKATPPVAGIENKTAGAAYQFNKKSSIKISQIKPHATANDKSTTGNKPENAAPIKEDNSLLNSPQAGNQTANAPAANKQPAATLPGAGTQNTITTPVAATLVEAGQQEAETPALPNPKPITINPANVATARHQWFFTIEAGSTNTQTTAGNQFGNADKILAAQSQNYLALTAPAAYKYPIEKPGTGFHLSAGVAYQQKLSPHWRVTAGLQAAYLSNTQTTGNYIKSSFYISPDQNFTLNGVYSGAYQQAAYYQGGSQNSQYKIVNKAWQLQAPVNISYVINPRSKTKFIIDGGVSVAWMVSSQWLIPDTRYQALYYNKAVLNNTLLSWQAGPSMEFFNHIKLGINYQQSFTTLAKNYVTPKLYWQNVSMYAYLPFSIKLKKTKK